jgi:hypothetical protein
MLSLISLLIFDVSTFCEANSLFRESWVTVKFPMNSAGVIAEYEAPSSYSTVGRFHTKGWTKIFFGQFLTFFY